MRLPVFFLIEKSKRIHLPDWFRQFVYFYPLTLSGTLLFVLSIVLFGKSYVNANPYGFVLSLFAFGALLILGVGGRVQASRFNRAQFHWDSAQPLYAGNRENEQHLRIEEIRPLPFYRLHFKISGAVRVGQNASLYISRDASSIGGEKLTVPLQFPFAGEFGARGSLRVRDIFGLTRARFGTDLIRNLIVQPAPFKEKSFYQIEALGGYEDKHRQKSSDEERYFMREYIPGDRFRDINWKSSSKLSQLITKISPYTQEKTRVICIEFRNFRGKGRETVESLVHLNVLKSWLLSFIRTVKNENPEYHFLVQTGREAFRLETDEQIDQFSLVLSTLFFQSESLGSRFDAGTNEIHIFSTPYDKNLPMTMASYQKAKTYVFRTVGQKSGVRKGRTIHLFPSPKSTPLPGSWILFRDRLLPNPEIGFRETERLREFPIAIQVW